VASFECVPINELVRLIQQHADKIQFKPNAAVVLFAAISAATLDKCLELEGKAAGSKSKAGGN